MAKTTTHSRIKKSIVTYRAPNHAYAKIKDCAGGTTSYIHGADIISILGLQKGVKVFSRVYTPVSPTTDVIDDEFVQRDDSDSDSTSKHPTSSPLPRKETNPTNAPHIERGTVTFLPENCAFLVIRVCQTGESAYFPNAYDTVRQLSLEQREDDRTVWFERDPKRPDRVLRVKLY